MDIPKTYSPAEAEKRWYAHWLEQHFFKSEPDNRIPYTIVIPPPNVTGVLHMGHMLNNTIQDVLIRRARMRGFNACWVPGTDHASIATEARVVKLLAEKGIRKSDLTRDEFLKHAWEWKEKYGNIILEQLKKLGASCDWDRTDFTMNEDMTDAVLDVFIDLHKKGLIYRGVRMVNWDPAGQTAVSDEEVIHKETKSRLVYVKYKIEGSDEAIVVATTRPETIMGDTAVCVNPSDERYKHLRGKKVIVPVVNRAVPVIFDEYVDPAFGTGALKVTPAHDINDFNLGLRHKLPVIDALTSDGKISEAAGAYTGMDRFACRKKIVADLTALGLMEKTEEITNKVGYSERTDAVIEPRLSMQWFLKMDEISKPALNAVLNEDVALLPEKFINTYKHWMENVRDWCISRQLWWGQRIPAWYDDAGNTVVCKTREEAVSQLRAANASLNESSVRQDEDVLDTWFSSWLWPMTVFDADIVKKGWAGANEDLRYYYPTNDLVTAPEILFFWVARMMIAGYEYTGRKPFTNVYLTGIVRDQLGRKMSKSLGNSPDPLDLIDKYGADAIRVGVMLPSPAGNDLIFDTPLNITAETPLESKYCEQGRNFANKVWNAFRLISGFEPADIPQPAHAAAAVTWFGQKFIEQLAVIDDHFSKYRMSDALKTTYKLVWDDFCAWYLEAVKPDFVDGRPQPMDRQTHESTIAFLEDVLRVMHPWTPFITEEIWHLLKKRGDKDCIMVSYWPSSERGTDQNLLSEFEVCKELVTTVRNVRAQKQMSPREKLEVIERSDASGSLFDPVVIKLANLSSFTYSKEKVDGALSFVIRTTEFFIPVKGNINTDEERERLTKDLNYNQGFLKSVQAKLANEKFVANARPEVLAVERKKESDALSKIRTIQEQLDALK